MIVKPIIRWVGGKSAMLPHIKPPALYNRYREPFAGGLANFLSLPDRPDKKPAVLSDSNFYLMNFYSHLSGAEGSTKVYALVGSIRVLADSYRYCDDQVRWYYRIRSDMNSLISRGQLDSESLLIMASLFYVINRLSFNGLWRVNRSGGVNAPHDKSKREVLFKPHHFGEVEGKLYYARIHSMDFDEALAGAEHLDWVFADPPYYDVYDKYGKAGFNAEDHVRLANTMRRLDKIGVYFTLTNRNCPEVREMYEGFHMQVITQNNNINSQASGRKAGREDLIVTNFEVDYD